MSQRSARGPVNQPKYERNNASKTTEGLLKLDEQKTPRRLNNCIYEREVNETPDKNKAYENNICISPPPIIESTEFLALMMIM